MKKFYLLGALAIALATSLVMGNNIEAQALNSEQDEALSAAAQEIKKLPGYDKYAKLFEATTDDELKAAIRGVKADAAIDDASTDTLRDSARQLPNFYNYKYLYALVYVSENGGINEPEPDELLELMQKAVEVCKLLFGVTRAERLAEKAAVVATVVETPSAPSSQTVAPASQAAPTTANRSLASTPSEPVVVTTATSKDLITEVVPSIENMNENSTVDVVDDAPLSTIFAHTATGVTSIAAAGATLVANRQSGKGARRGRR